MDRTFPILPEGLEIRLAAIEMQIKGDPGFLDDPKCPYSPRLRDFLARLGKAEGVAKPEEEAEAKAGWTFEAILDEIEKTIRTFDRIERDIEMAETSERIAFVKAKTQLMERWIAQKERTFSMKEMADFQRVVLGVIEDLLDKDGRMELKQRLRSLSSIQIEGGE